MALRPTNAGQKVHTAPLLHSQRTKAGRGGGGRAHGGVPLERRQSCDALDVDHQTSFLCVKPRSYTQRHSLQVCTEFFRAREDDYSLLLRHTEKCQPWDASHGMPPSSLCFKPSGLQLDVSMSFLIEK